MMKRKYNTLLLLFVLSISFLASSVTAVLLHDYQSKNQFAFLNDFCGELAERQPEAQETVLELLKEKESLGTFRHPDYLSSFGYTPADFSADHGMLLKSAGIGFLAGAVLFFTAFFYWKKKITRRIRTLTDSLERVNTGKGKLLLETSEDEFSKLQDEIYKTVTSLYQTRDLAIEAKNRFADNLSNIAHQLKTPITSISLSVQMLQACSFSQYLTQMKQQLDRLTHLEEALLLLSRIDAGALVLKAERTDLFTLLTLAADNLQELSARAGVFLDVPEMGEISIEADLDWTMEAVMNVMKNCMEHSARGKTVHVSYEENPLYVQMKIWDEGTGFSEEEIPHLFERFFRGKNAGNDSTGIGLSIAKEIIEMQNGILMAYNLPQGGACFEIRMYCH